MSDIAGTVGLYSDPEGDCCIRCTNRKHHLELMDALGIGHNDHEPAGYEEDNITPFYKLADGTYWVDSTLPKIEQDA